MPAAAMDELVALAKRRGFIFPASDIYGGLQGVYDYGPLGVELKNNLKAAWWRAMVYERDDVEGLDASILTHPKTLQHSGHEATFSDPAGGLPELQEPFSRRPPGVERVPELRRRRPHGTQAFQSDVQNRRGSGR